TPAVMVDLLELPSSDQRFARRELPVPRSPGLVVFRDRENPVLLPGPPDELNPQRKPPGAEAHGHRDGRNPAAVPRSSHRIVSGEDLLEIRFERRCYSGKSRRYQCIEP